MGDKHAEAFRLMKYASKDGSEVEWIWNSRDGVTPFIVHSRSGTEIHHVDWHLDFRLPNYNPLPGERIFVNMTDGMADLLARSFVEKNWEELQSLGLTKDEVIKIQFEAYYGDGDRPALISAAEWKPPAQTRRVYGGRFA